jgi:hypothetical protein
VLFPDIFLALVTVRIASMTTAIAKHFILLLRIFSLSLYIIIIIIIIIIICTFVDALRDSYIFNYVLVSVSGL